MFPYWLLLALFSAGSFLSQGQERDQSRLPRFLLAAAVFTALVIGLRYKVGADWEAYREMFWEMKFLSLPKAIVRTDPGFGLVNWLARYLQFRFWVVNFICAAIFVYGLVRFCAQQTSPWLSMCVAVPYIVIVVGMGYNRQSAALGFIFLALVAINRRSLPQFLMWMAAATLFHKSALLLLPIIALSYSRNRITTLALGAVTTVLAYYFVAASGVDTYIARYSGQEQGAIESGGTLVRIIMNIVPAIVFLIFRNRFPVAKDITATWRTFSLLALGTFVAYMYFGNNTAIDRLSVYLCPLQIFVLGNLPFVMSPNRRGNKIAVLLVVLYSAAVQAVWLFYADNARFWIPYRLYPF